MIAERSWATGCAPREGGGVRTLVVEAARKGEASESASDAASVGSISARFFKESGWGCFHPNSSKNRAQVEPSQAAEGRTHVFLSLPVMGCSGELAAEKEVGLNAPSRARQPGARACPGTG